jgi:cytosol alanyl aminopeptidase
MRQTAKTSGWTSGKAGWAVTVFYWERLAIHAHFDVLMGRLPEETLARMPRWGRELCTREERAGLQSFYTERVAKYPGGSRNLAQALETVDICVANRKVQEARLKRFLAAQK